MKLVKLFALMLAVALLVVSNATAGEAPEVTLKMNGTIQSWASYAQTNTDTAQVGFGLRRVRARMVVGIGDVKAFVQMELTSPKLLDARIQFKLSDNMELRMGRFISAGMRGAGLTSHTVIDIVERPVSAQTWGSKTVGADFRDYGVALEGKMSDLNYKLSLHNGDGALNIKPSHKSTATGQAQGVAMSGMLFYKPADIKGLEVGGYYGMGNKYVNEYTSYNAYAYYEPGPFRIKAEMVSVKDAAEVTFNGYYGFGAYSISEKVELLARYEVVDLNADVDDDEQTDITIGASYFLYPGSKSSAKLTAAYVMQQEAGDAVDNDVFYLATQIVF